MAYKFIEQKDEKGWNKKTKGNELTYDKVVDKICDKALAALSGKNKEQMNNTFRVADDADTYNLRLLYGQKYIATVEITLTGDNKGKGLPAAKKEAKDIIKSLRTTRRIVDGKKIVVDEGLHTKIQKAFEERAAANAKMKANKGLEKKEEKKEEPAKVASTPSVVAKPVVPAPMKKVAAAKKVGRRW